MSQATQARETAPQPQVDLLEIRDLKLQFNSLRGTVKALDGVNLAVREREIIGLVGESGCGKTITGLCVLGLLPKPQTEITHGEIRFRGENLLDKSEHELQSVRGRLVSMVFQDPLASLNPVFTIGEQIERVVRLHKRLSSREARETARSALARAGLPADDAILDSYPHQLSGGMRQRACMAMAISCDSPLLIADEPTTALDVTIQAQILRLLLEPARRARRGPDPHHPQRRAWRPRPATAWPSCTPARWSSRGRRARS